MEDKAFQIDMDITEDNYADIPIITPRRSRSNTDEDYGSIHRNHESSLKYAVDDIPPWYECIVLALQQILTVFSSSVVYSGVLVDLICVEDAARNDVFGMIFSAFLFTQAVATFLQVTFGTRLSIFQGPSSSYVYPLIVIMNLPEWRCPEGVSVPWGWPTFSTAGVTGMVTGVLGSIIDSIGDYYANAKISGAPPPPDHAINRGLGMEGVGVLVSGMWGGLGVTTYSIITKSISITRVGSRRVNQWTSLILLIMAIPIKFAILMSLIPPPVLGGVLWIACGLLFHIYTNKIKTNDIQLYCSVTLIALYNFLHYL
ncbi:solute carrier family 23 member 2-like [Saccoglossus kowalevskii]